MKQSTHPKGTINPSTSEDIVMPLLQKYQNLVEEKIKSNSHLFGPETKLSKACLYSLTNGGKRLRPALVFIIADALKSKYDVTYGALAIEFFHTASLVADDLPCMDNDDERRHKPTVHKLYGEAMALLVSYGLIAAGYECIGKNAKMVTERNGSQDICSIAIDYASRNTGLLGATGGQFLDIFPPDLTEKTLREVLHKKTVSLFEIAFVFGWLFGGGDVAKLPNVVQAASHFGMAYQIADDLDDVIQDGDKCRDSNFARTLGQQYAIKAFHKEIAGCRATLQLLQLCSPELEALLQYLESQVREI